MKHSLRIQRISYRDDCTLGVLYADGDILAVTLEEPWKENKPNVSCVPEGVYNCIPHDGIKFNNVYKLENVPNRQAILLHSGNTTDDIEGCILLGSLHGKLAGKTAVLKSREAVELLRDLVGRNEFTLVIQKV